MSDIETNLNQSPYFDDFDEDKNFHRVLFRPGYAVQARELTQLQTILQKQLGRLSNEVFIDGAIVKGGGIRTGVLGFVKLRDKDANNRSLIIGDFYTGSAVANLTITGATTGMTAKLISATAGSEAAAPDYFTVHVAYTNSGSNNNVKAFANNETLIFRHSSNNGFKVAANTIVTAATGYGLKVNVSDGILYHKENFIKFPEQSVIVGKYTISPNAYIGFTTTESIVDSNADQSLLDNSSGSTNYTAPGANRLKLVGTLTSKSYGFANTTSFFRIAELRNGNVIQKPLDRNLSTIGKFVAERIYDSSGNFAVTPFNIRIREHLNRTNSFGRLTTAEGGDANKLLAEIEPGTAYVNGEKIQTTATEFLELEKATDNDTQDAVVVGQQFGHYVNVKEVVGTWDFQGLRTVSLRDTRQHGISGENLGAQAVSGTEIGTARVRGMQWDSGTPGTYNAQFRIYLFDVSMNSGKSFADVRGLYVNNTTGPKSMADIVLETNGTAKIQEPGLNSLVFPTGLKAIKQYADSTGTNDTQFVFRTEKTVNFATNGTATVTANTAHAGGTETMNETGSPLTNAEERNILVVARETVSTAAHTGTVTQSGNTVTGVGTAFTTQYQVGDFIKIGSNDPMRITEISGATTLKTANTQTVAGASAHATTFPIGYIFDLSGNGSITSTSSTHTINLQQANLASTFSASVYFNRLRSSAVPASKTVNKNKFVHINTGSHSASNDGPWPLGVSDAFKIVAVYKGSNTGVTSSDTDVTTHFELDSGMKDGFYDTSYLKKKATSTLNTTNAGLLVKFNYFGRDRSAGIGFLTVDSYPVDDTNTANTTAITTQEIPLFTSPTSGITRDLRDSVDFRPIKSNTVTPSANAVATQTPSITNPTASSAYNIDSDGAHMPTPNENFQADIQYYLPRKDRIVINPVGTMSVIKGNPDLSPKTPDAPVPSMSLATLEIPPYPSLSPAYAEYHNRTDYQVKMALDNNRRYTMADLRAVDSRVKSLEYYSSLNLLENLTLNKQVFNDATATDRFKNGFFVDNFVNLKFADTKNPYLRVAIDKDDGVLRPSYRQNYVPMNTTIVDTAGLDSTNYQKTGDMVTLSYTNRELHKQPYASKKRVIVQELLFNWEGQVNLDPPMDNVNDTTTLPELQVDFDGFYEGILDTLRFQGINPSRVEFGNWRTTSSRRNGRVITTTQDRTITTTTLGSITEEISLGNSVNSVSVREFMRSKVIRFTGVGMRPGTRVHPYFDTEKVFNYCTPTNSSFVATGVEGANLVTDSTGTVYGLFRIPNDDNLKFRQGTKKFVLQDISDPETESDIVSTYASGEYTSISLDVVEQERTINARLPRINVGTQNQTRVTTTVLPPPAPPRNVFITNRAPTGFCFVAGTKVRMADGTEKNIEDVQIGEHLLGQDSSSNKVLDFDHHELEGRNLIGINGNGAFMTEDHPLMTQSGWKAYDSELVKQNKAEIAHLMTNGSLQVGDSILTVDGSWVKVESLEVFENEPEQKIYNFYLDGNHTYHADGFLAHNRCFRAGTKVLMEDGSLKLIEDVQVGEKLVGKDGKVNTVLNWHRPLLNSYDDVLEQPLRMSSINGGEFDASEDHMFMTTEGWKAPNGPACEIIHKEVLESEGMDGIETLQVGDQIITSSGNVTVNSIEIKEDDPELQLYNFALDGSRTYHVVMHGHEEPMLVHNKGGCFVAGTSVTMADGSTKNIEDVKIGESLLGQDGAVNKVVDLWRPTLGDRKLISFNKGDGFVTDDHPVWTREGWKSFNPEKSAEKYDFEIVGRLSAGDELLQSSGEWIRVENIVIESADSETQLYNFKLDGNNTYFANDLLVHNKSCFVKGTIVTIADGSKKKIEEVEIGEVLLGQDGSKNKVLEHDHPMLNGRELIGLNNNGPFMTPEHPLYTQDGWKSYRLEDTLEAYPHLKEIMVGELQVGDKIKTESGDWDEITSIEVFDSEPNQRVYNFILDGNNTYFADGLLAHNRDPLAQSFEVLPAVSSDGVYITKVDLFFAKKDANLPITLQIREMENGFPTTIVVAEKTLPSSSVSVSSDASSATTFTFDNLVYLDTAKEYTLVAIPGGYNDQYLMWVAEMGGDDVLLPNTKITKQTATGILFASSNDRTWKQFQDEDMKYTIYCAQFTSNDATVYIDNDEMEYLTIDELDGNLQVGENVVAESVLTFANNKTISVGNVIKSKHAANNNSVRHAGYANGVVRQIVTSGSGSVTVKVDPFGTFSTTATGNTNNLYVDGTWVGNTSAFTANTAQGTVSFYFGVAGKMHLSSSAGGFANGYVRGQTSGGSARVTSVDNLVMNTLVPKLPVITHANTGANFSVRSTSTTGTISPSWKAVQLGTDNDFLDGEKKVYSYSNESSLSAVNGSTKSLMLKAVLSSNNDYVSPIIDLNRANMLIVENQINNDATDEHKTYGNASMRYISKPVTLADGQDAEDLVVFMDAYKPVNSDIKVYARLLNGEDGETLEDKDFTLMTQVTASNTYSSGLDGTDFKEFEFGFSANTNGQGFLTSANNFARLNSANSNVVAYRGTDGSIYHTYKTFALKIVMTSSGTHIVPKVDNIRAVALQK